MAHDQNTTSGGAAAPLDTDKAEAREEMADRMTDEAADIALAAVDELAYRNAQIDKQRTELEALQTELNAAQQELETTKQQFLRQAAEYQNYRRRTEQEKIQLVSLGKTMVVQQILDVVDDFERSLSATQQAEGQRKPAQAYETLKQGVELVYRKFHDELERLGVKPIDAVGTPFDENLHEAMMQQPALDGAAPGTVLQELQKGYRLGDRIIRHAKVIVAV